MPRMLIDPVRVRPRANEANGSADEDYTPPHIQPGWFFHFFPGGDRNTTPHNGICKAVSRTSITGDVYENGHIVNRINIRHVNDPRAQAQAMKMFGAWDLVDTREMQAVIALAARVAELETAAGKKPPKAKGRHKNTTRAPDAEPVE